jgi:uncharacterized protein (TIGR02145 family)
MEMEKAYKLFAFMLGGSFMAIGCSTSFSDGESASGEAIKDSAWVSPFNTAIQYGTVADSRDKRKYRTVKIGPLNWMAENLDYDTKDTNSSVCYDNDPENCAKFGRLYTRQIALGKSNDSALSFTSGICPEGWHIPSWGEWTLALNYVHNRYSDKDAPLLRSAGNWAEDSLGAGLDAFGFSALPGGGMDKESYKTTFSGKDSLANWWLPELASTYYVHDPYFFSVLISTNSYYVQRAAFSTYKGKTPYYKSVRCVENYSLEPQSSPFITYGSFTDNRDGHTYKTVQLGTQEWMAENLNYDGNGGRCFADNAAYCSIFGRLYDWDAAMTSCPEGWRLPSSDDFAALGNYVFNAQDTSAGRDSSGTLLKTELYWKQNKETSKFSSGNNAFGFNGLPGGVFDGSSFSGLGEKGLWWTESDLFDTDTTSDASSLANFSSSLLISYRVVRSKFFSVRCIKKDL